MKTAALQGQGRPTEDAKGQVVSVIDRLRDLVPSDQFSTQADQLKVASEDESTIAGVLPEAVIWAMSPEEVQQVVKTCYESGTPVTTRGGGSALEGSAIPVQGGVVLDLSRMANVLKYWPEDLQVRVEPGIIYDNLNNKLKRDGLFFPPSPGGSGDLATIGGMIATNASGIYSVKYGATREYILELDVVIGTGERMSLGNRAIKRSSGYNLVELVCGSEGTLAVICNATIRLSGLPEGRLQAAYHFPDDVSGARAVSEMRRYGLDIAAIEFMDSEVMTALNLLKEYGLKESPTLFLEFHGPDEVTSANKELANDVCEELGGEEFRLRDDHNPWEIRHWVTEAIKHRKKGFTIIRNDVAFPISRLPDMIGYCHELSKETGLMIHAFGHVGMGLLHALILADREDASSWNAGMEANRKIVEKAVALDGTVSGEHGIGLGHKEAMVLEHGDAIELMRKIKKQFDPKGILNPGKIFDL